MEEELIEESIADLQAESVSSFTIDATEAAKILDVNRTRLSQLTTKGTFPFERKKINHHNKLFYRLNDLLSYQRQHTYGNWSKSDDVQVQMKRYEERILENKKIQDVKIIENEKSIENFDADIQNKNNILFPLQQNKKVGINKTPFNKATLKKAEDVQKEKNQESCLKDLIKKTNEIDFLQKKMDDLAYEVQLLHRKIEMQIYKIYQAQSSKAEKNELKNSKMLQKNFDLILKLTNDFQEINKVTKKPFDKKNTFRRNLKRSSKRIDRMKMKKIFKMK